MSFNLQLLKGQLFLILSVYSSLICGTEIDFTNVIFSLTEALHLECGPGQYLPWSSCQMPLLRMHVKFCRQCGQGEAAEEDTEQQGEEEGQEAEGGPARSR